MGKGFLTEILKIGEIQVKIMTETVLSQRSVQMFDNFLSVLDFSVKEK